MKRTSTARARLVAALTDEILNNPEPAAYPIASEHQLCRRFSVSRVTIRLALSDLENRGLIYRKHGKGTFAHGKSTRVYRNLGLLLRCSRAVEHRPIAEMTRGAQTTIAPLRAGMLILSTSPEEWRPEKAASLGGVIVVPQAVTVRDLQTLQDRNLPYYIFGESSLPGPHLRMGQRGAARKMTEDLLALGHRRFAILSGFDEAMDAPKRQGVHDALTGAGIDPAQVPELSSNGQESEIYSAARAVLELQPRPTAVIAFDDSLGATLSFSARRQEGLKVPEDLSIVSFHEWPFLNFVEPALTNVRFEFFRAGQCAAEALNQAALTGEPLNDLHFEPVYVPGQTIGPVPQGQAG